MSVETTGKVIDEINVKISYRIIELFSAGLYSSPNKAFEELVCNSYDALASDVAVYVPPDLKEEGAHIWVCDNGESMDKEGLKDLWKIGESNKRNPNSDEKRMQIGRFGIGKLATYILTRNLTYICKKKNQYLATTMNYEKITDEKEAITLDERKLTVKEAENVLHPFLKSHGRNMIPFKLFGKGAEKSWTFTILTRLKPKATEIKEGRLKWILSTALPLNPQFNLTYNGAKIESNKIKKTLRKRWVIGKEDKTLDSFGFAEPRKKGSDFFIDFENLEGVYGEIELYEDSLVGANKSAGLGRSHGIFLMVRGRLVNLDDPLLGMEPFSHGAFNRTRIIVHADGLDSYLTSTRESVKDSPALSELKEYLKSKFNNEVRKVHFEEEKRKEDQKSIASRLAQTSLTISKKPLYGFAQKFYNSEITNPYFIEMPPADKKESLLEELKEELSSEESIIKNVSWELLDTGAPIARLDLLTGNLKINLLHPYIANYNDYYNSVLPIEIMATTEVLTEAHLYEIGIDETDVHIILKRRDSTFRELSLSDREGAPAVAIMLKDAIADSTGLEEAVHNAFLALGFESKKIARKGTPDGKADAILGYSENDINENYSLTYDAKSTGKSKVKAATAGLAGVKDHQTEYKADFSVVIATDYEGADDPESKISRSADQQKITVMKVDQLVKLLLLSAPKQIGLKRLKELFTNCYKPVDVEEWINKVQKEEVNRGPVKELLDSIYELQNEDTEPPEFSSVRMKLNDKISKKLSKKEIRSLAESLEVLVPGFINIEGEKIGIQGRPAVIMGGINSAIHNSVPTELQEIYLSAFTTNFK